MKATNWKQTAIENKNDPIVAKLLKRVKTNIILWFIALVVMAAVGGILTWLAISKGWENPKRLVAIVIPWIATGIILAMDIIIVLGNKVGVLNHNGQQIIFYSGINTNLVYIDGVLMGKGTSEDKLRCTLNNDYILNVVFKLTDFDILIKKRSEIEALEEAAKGRGNTPTKSTRETTTKTVEQKNQSSESTRHGNVELVVDVKNKITPIDEE